MGQEVIDVCIDGLYYTVPSRLEDSECSNDLYNTIK